MIANLWQDLRFAGRVLPKQPSFALMSIVILALGIAGPTTIFTLFNGLLLRPFPVPNQGRLVDLNETDPKVSQYVGPQYSHFCAWREHNQTFGSMAACAYWASNLAVSNQTERVGILLATHDYFEVLGIRPVLGRRFTAQEDRPGGPNVVLVSYRVWERLFHKDPAAVGKTLRLDDEPFTVIGVLPLEASFPNTKDVWRPLQADPSKGQFGLGVGLGSMALGRLKNGASIKQAQDDLTRIQKSLAALRPGEQPYLPVVTGFRDRYLSVFKFVFPILLGVVGFALLIACANVTSLMLARGANRSREFAMRVALGATQGRIVRQILAESLVLSVLGGLFGVLLSHLAVEMVQVSLARVIPEWLTFSMDSRFVLFCLLVVAMAGVASGLLPALHAALPKDLVGFLRGLAAGVSASPGKLKALNAIVVGQIALCLALLVGSGLFFRTLLKVQRLDPGFRMEGLLTYGIPLPIGPYFDENKRLTFFAQHLEAVQRLPGVEHATLCTSLPFGYLNVGQFEREGAPAQAATEPNPTAVITSVMPGYFETLGMQLRAGRVFTSWDNRRDGERTALVNETFAERFWPGEAAVGKRIRRQGSPDWVRVVGVVKDAVNGGVDQTVWPSVYVSCAWDAPFVVSGMVRASGNPLSLMPAIREVVRSADPAIPIDDVQTMPERLRESLWGRRILAWLVGVPAVAAAIMACAGIFGVISYSVSQRTREIGIRLALGAHRTNVLRLLLREGMTRVAVGIGLGLGGAVALTRVLESLLFGVTATDPLTFVLSTLLLGVAALAASWFPARRAARVDPMVALRYE